LKVKNARIKNVVYVDWKDYFLYRSKKNDIRPIGIDLPGITPLTGHSYQYNKQASYNSFYLSPLNVSQNITRFGIKPGSSPENSFSVSNG
jgi:hypothetical protein